MPHSHLVAELAMLAVTSLLATLQAGHHSQSPRWAVRMMRTGFGVAAAFVAIDIIMEVARLAVPLWLTFVTVALAFIGLVGQIATIPAYIRSTR